MTTSAWFLVVGAVLLFMAASAARLKRLPLSTAMVYLAVGVVLGPTATGAFHINPLEHSKLLEVITEIAVVVSVFGAGLKLAAPVGDRIWWIPFRLATVSMVVTVLLIAAAGVLLLGLPVGAAVLLGAVLAPTDPVLASDVQVRHPKDDHPVRFALTGEAGLNDGTAFPFVMLGLGLMGLHPLGEGFSRWLMIDVLWACAGGLMIGGALGAATAWIVNHLRKLGIHSEYMEDFLGLGLIALSYGAALLLHTYGFLAVFAAGFLLHRVERYLDRQQETGGSPDGPSRDVGDADVDSEDPFMATVSLAFVEQLERLFTVALIIAMGGMLFVNSWQLGYVLLAILLLTVIRPLGIGIGLVLSAYPAKSQAIIGWFGVKGIGSLYYLFYALQHGIDDETAVTITSAVLVVIAISIVAHGVTVTPLMRFEDTNADSHPGQ